MKRILIAAFAAVIGFSMAMPEAEAKRLGGGSSSGMRRDSGIMKREAAPTQAAPSQAGKPTPAGATPQPSGMSRWMGPIAGLAAGLGIAALLSHFGLGEGVANFVMLALLVMAAIFVFRLLFRKREPQGAMQYAGMGAQGGRAPNYEPARFDSNAVTGGASVDTAAIPAGFDADGFVRQAKLNFVRLQAANDAGNMDDIRNFTTPELFAEIQLQYQERGRAVQQTDVVQLNADLLDVSNEGAFTIASVRFHGQLRETPNTAPESFSEVWHLVRPLDGSKGWVVAGIQQDE